MEGYENLKSLAQFSRATKTKLVLTISTQSFPPRQTRPCLIYQLTRCHFREENKTFYLRSPSFLYRSLLQSFPTPDTALNSSLFCSRSVFYNQTRWKVQSERVFWDSRLFLYDTSPSTESDSGSVLRGNFDVVPVRPRGYRYAKNGKWVAAEFLQLRRTLDWIQRQDSEKQAAPVRLYPVMYPARFCNS